MNVSESLKLGAFDLKSSANRNLAIGFGVALLIVVGLTGGGSKAFQPKEEIDTVALAATGPVTLEDFVEEDLEAQEPPPPDEYVPPPPPPPAAATAEVGTGSEGRIGQLIATAEEIEGPNIADMSEIEFANNVGGGDGGAVEFDPNAITIDDEVDLKNREESVPTEQVEAYPDFVPNATPPDYNKSELTANANYPPTARENGIEGKVILMVYLSKTGKVDKVEVLRSDYKIFNDEAIAAVKRTQFTPAMQNDLAITYRLPVTVEFRLR